MLIEDFVESIMARKAPSNKFVEGRYRLCDSIKISMIKGSLKTIKDYKLIAYLSLIIDCLIILKDYKYAMSLLKPYIQGYSSVELNEKEIEKHVSIVFRYNTRQEICNLVTDITINFSKPNKRVLYDVNIATVDGDFYYADNYIDKPNKRGGDKVSAFISDLLRAVTIHSLIKFRDFELTNREESTYGEETE